jgi:hypothetical protein
MSAAEVMTDIGIVGSSFDYSMLPAEIGREARAAAERIKQHMRTAFLDVGAELARIKERLPHGRFAPWLQAEFGMTARTAQNYMAAAALAAKYEIISLLPPTIIYASAPTTPEPARQEIVDRLQRGESVGYRDARDVIDDAKDRRREEERQAKQQAELARLSPRARKSRAQREAEHEREQQEYRRKRDASKAVAAKAAELIIGSLGQRAPELAVLLEALEYGSDLYTALCPAVRARQRDRWA